MDRKITKNYIYNLVYQILLVVSPVITMPFLSRSLGVEAIGEYSYAYSLTSYFVLLATLGCDIYGRREISYVKDDMEKRSKKFWNIQIIKIVSTILVIFIYIIFSNFNSNRILLFILVFHLINVPLNIGWFYQGIEEFKKITIRGFFLKIIDLLFVIIFIHDPDDLVLYVFGSSFINFLAFFVLWIDIKKYVKFVPLKFLHPTKDLKDSIVFFLPAIATSIYTLLDKTMLGLITGNYTENGYYEQAQKVNVILLRVVLALGTVLLPRIASAYKKNDFNSIKRDIQKSARYVFFISIAIAFGLVCISDLFVPWFFGEEFNKVSMLLKISGFILIFQGLEDVFGMQYLVSIGKQKQYIISLFIGAFTNFICNMILIPKFQSGGALIASLIGEFVIVSSQIIMIKGKIEVKKIIFSSKNYLISGIVMCIPLLFLERYLKSNIMDTFLVIILGAGLYLGTLLILKDELVWKYITTIKGKIKKIMHKRKI